MKRCRKCLEIKPDDEFYVFKTHTCRSCKSCERERAMVRYYATREAYLEKIKTPEWRLQRKIRTCTR